LFIIFFSISFGKVTVRFLKKRPCDSRQTSGHAAEEIAQARLQILQAALGDSASKSANSLFLFLFLFLFEK